MDLVIIKPPIFRALSADAAGVSSWLALALCMSAWLNTGLGSRALK